MVFSSLTFLLVFLPIVFILHTVIRSTPARNALLIVASLVFYAYGEPVYVLLMVASTVFNYAMGRAVGAFPVQTVIVPRSGGAHGRHSLEASGAQKKGPEERLVHPSAQKLLLAVAVVGNLAVLAVFKYADFFVSNINLICGAGLPLPQITLPIGISFFTFQAMSYVVDVYRGKVPAEPNYARVLLYISFFPQLIAGPIVKYHDIALQIQSRQVTVQGVALGLRRFCFGLGKKVLIANTLAVAVDSLFGASLGNINILGAWIAAIAYMLQIYFDFSAYSDMAIGLGHMFGFTIKENFDYPYRSTTIKEFWRRWHISLSTWFREYVYIPLGGNRKGRPRAVANKMIVFLTCGLWHGASWTFVLWGLFHGLFLLIEEYVPLRKLPRPIGWLYAMLVVCIGFVLFRADSLGQAGWFIAQMFTGFSFTATQMSLVMQQLTPLFIATVVVALVAALPVKPALEAYVERSGIGVQNAVRVVTYIGAVAILVLCILELAGGSYNPFIYFRF